VIWLFGGLLCTAGGLLVGVCVGRLAASATISELLDEVDHLADRLGFEHDEEVPRD
jgi:hypothetical protein